MNPLTRTFSDIFSVGAFSCIYEIGPKGARTTWLPVQPVNLSQAERDQYRTGRDRVLIRTARITGKNIAIAEKAPDFDGVKVFGPNGLIETIPNGKPN